MLFFNELVCLNAIIALVHEVMLLEILSPSIFFFLRLGKNTSLILLSSYLNYSCCDLWSLLSTAELSSKKPGSRMLQRAMSILTQMIWAFLMVTEHFICLYLYIYMGDEYSEMFVHVLYVCFLSSTSHSPHFISEMHFTFWKILLFFMWCYDEIAGSLAFLVYSTAQH